jgi:hypothetical protein
MTVRKINSFTAEDAETQRTAEENTKSCFSAFLCVLRGEAVDLIDLLT